MAQPAAAATLRFANDYDVRSLDPYAGQETFLRSFDANIYEPLVRRGRDLALEPALATSWTQTAPDRWRFTLRRGVVFQGGEPFSADDVVFSFARAVAANSKIAGHLAAVRDVRAIDEHAIEFRTNGADPILPDQLSDWPIMSRAWCQAHAAAEPADIARGDSFYASDHADGTGPFMVSEREPETRTVLVPNPRWWDRRQDNLDAVVFTPIADPKLLVGGLESGALDMIYTVPPQDVDRIAATPGLRIVEGPGLRTIFLGFDQWRGELRDGNVKGRNPFKDHRVREAIYRAIDERAIAAKVMRGDATPAALLVAPGIDGFDAGLDRRLGYDPALARRLLAEAGYPDGFATALDCPDGRYVNDEAICEEVVAMLAQVGIKLQLRAQSRADFFTQILPPRSETSFFLMGWLPSTGDAQAVLVNLAATRDPAAHLGDYNVGGYANPALDRLIARIAVETSRVQRLALLRQAMTLVRDDIAYIPLHRENVVWAARAGIQLVQRADDSFPLRYVRLP